MKRNREKSKFVMVCLISQLLWQPCRQAYWDRHDYSSLNLPLDSEGSSEESEGADEWVCEGGEDKDIRYLVGDVTRPQQTGTSDAIVVHCVGECVCVGVCVCVCVGVGVGVCVCVCVCV